MHVFVAHTAEKKIRRGGGGKGGKGAESGLVDGGAREDDA